MTREHSRQKQKLEEFFRPSFLDSLTDPYHVFSKIAEYYDGLSDNDKTAFENAVMDWLDVNKIELTKAERLKLSNALRVCGYLKISRATEKILAIARRYGPLRDPHNVYQNDLATGILLGIVGSLGEIGDPMAIEFLKEEASHCGDINPNRASIFAISALSKIDLNIALDFLPIEIIGDIRYKEKRSWVSEENRQFGLVYDTFLDLIGYHGRSIIARIAQRLQELPLDQKQFAFEAFKAVMKRSVLEAADGRIKTDEEKSMLVKQFSEGLGLTPDGKEKS